MQAASNANDPFAGFGGVDPFAAQQQQFYQQQQVLQQQQMFQQQQMMHHQPPVDFFGGISSQRPVQPTNNNPFSVQQQPNNLQGGNPFNTVGQYPNNSNNNALFSSGGFAPAQSAAMNPHSPPKTYDVSRNPNSTIDPFASISERSVNPSGPNSMLNHTNPSSIGANPFFSQQSGSNIAPAQTTAQRPLFDIDATSLSSSASIAAVPKNPFSVSSANANRFQWEAPKQPKPSLAQLQAASAGISNVGSAPSSAFSGNVQLAYSNPMAMSSSVSSASSGYQQQQLQSSIGGSQQHGQMHQMAPSTQFNNPSGGFNNGFPSQTSNVMPIGVASFGNYTPMGASNAAPNPFGNSQNNTMNSSATFVQTPRPLQTQQPGMNFNNNTFGNPFSQANPTQQQARGF